MRAAERAGPASAEAPAGAPTDASGDAARPGGESSRPGVLTRAATWPLEILVVAYRTLISPLLPPSCRFYPSCSTYALTALRRFGPVIGTWLVVRRLAHCHPWTSGGVDHVPPRGPRGLPDWPAYRADAARREAEWACAAGGVEDAVRDDDCRADPADEPHPHAQPHQHPRHADPVRRPESPVRRGML